MSIQDLCHTFVSRELALGETLPIIGKLPSPSEEVRTVIASVLTASSGPPAAGACTTTQRRPAVGQSRFKENAPATPSRSKTPPASSWLGP